jgi:hypothetical protein
MKIGKVLILLLPMVLGHVINLLSLPFHHASLIGTQGQEARPGMWNPKSWALGGKLWFQYHKCDLLRSPTGYLKTYLEYFQMAKNEGHV